MTSCRNITNLLSAFHDGELSAEQTRRVEAHLSECAACRARCEQFASVSERMKAHAQIVPSPDFDARVVAAAVAQAQRVTWMDRIEAWLARPLLRLGVSFAVAVMLSAAVAWTANRVTPAPNVPSSSLMKTDFETWNRIYAGVWRLQRTHEPQTPSPTPRRRTKGDAPSWQKDLSFQPSRRFSC